MYQHGGTIRDALTLIESENYVLPAIQREFVWRPWQICSLFDSVMQGYPFGEFLYWKIDRENAHRYRWYGFVQNYHQRDNPHCPDLGVICDRSLTAVLDGQQRLTAFNIGLKGSMAVKRPRLWWNNPRAFPCRVLALDLLAPSGPDEDGNRYTFDFIDKKRIGRTNESLWFRVSNILTFDPDLDISEWIDKWELPREQRRVASKALNRLYNATCVDPSIVYYQETAQDLDRVLHIFIRRNSGGTVLSYSDLLLSIAVSQWTVKDARKEVHGLVDELNEIGNGFNLSKDFVLKAGLMLTDIASVGFRVSNFTHSNMGRLEENWEDIRDALIATVELVASFGFDSTNVRATSALLPIAYYLYRRGIPRDFATSDQYASDRKSIRGWLIRSILKTGVWSSGVDGLLTALREVIRKVENEVFPADELRIELKNRNKSLDFSSEEVEDLADITYWDHRSFVLLTLLFPFVDSSEHLHIDHVFPMSRFTGDRLKKEGVGYEKIESFRDCANRLGNLQLLPGDINNEKRARLPSKWLVKQFPNTQDCENYCEKHLLGNVPGKIKDFMTFFEARRFRMQSKIYELVNTV